MTTEPARPAAKLVTDRLVLRSWRPEDRPPFAALNADPAVMEYFPSPLTREQSDGFADRVEAHFERYGFGLWAVEVVDGPPFIGFVGLNVVAADDALPCAPALETGWRLARSSWGQGYASEAAVASLHFAFDRLQVDEVVAFTTVLNARSRAVMTRIGLTHDPERDFEHPRVPVGHRLRPHVLYRAARAAWSPPDLRAERAAAPSRGRPRRR